MKLRVPLELELDVPGPPAHRRTKADAEAMHDKVEEHVAAMRSFGFNVEVVGVAKEPRR